MSADPHDALAAFSMRPATPAEARAMGLSASQALALATGQHTEMVNAVLVENLSLQAEVARLVGELTNALADNQALTVKLRDAKKAHGHGRRRHH